MAVGPRDYFQYRQSRKRCDGDYQPGLQLDTKCGRESLFESGNVHDKVTLRRPGDCLRFRSDTAEGDEVHWQLKSVFRVRILQALLLVGHSFKMPRSHQFIAKVFEFGPVIYCEGKIDIGR